MQKHSLINIYAQNVKFLYVFTPNKKNNNTNSSKCYSQFEVSIFLEEKKFGGRKEFQKRSKEPVFLYRIVEEG